MLVNKTLGRVLAGALLVSLPSAVLPMHPATSSTLAASPSAALTSAQIGTTAASGAEAARAKKRYKPAKGALFNNPMGKPSARFRIEGHLIRAISHVPKGERIRISAYSLDRSQVANALIAAHRRGVKVQVLLNDHIVTPAQRRIASFLGNKTKKSSFLYRCDSGCRAQKTDYNNLHSKFYLFSKTGKARNVVMLGSANMTLNAVRWQWNDLWTGRNQDVLYDQFVTLFDDMRKDYDDRRPDYEFCNTGPVCDTATDKFHNWVFPRVSTPADDTIMHILNNVQCLYTTPTGKTKRTMLRLSMHTMRGVRGDYLAEKIRSLYAAGCDFKVNYGLMGFYTKSAIGAPTRRGRLPLRSTGFDLDPDVVEDPIDEVERYTHQKYLVIKGSWLGNTETQIVFTGSSNWASLGTPQDEIIFSIRGKNNMQRYLRNWNFMWKAPYSRDAYTTTYSSYRVTRSVDGQMITEYIPRKVVTVEPDGYVGAGATWEDD